MKALRFVAALVGSVLAVAVAVHLADGVAANSVPASAGPRVVSLERGSYVFASPVAALWVRWSGDSEQVTGSVSRTSLLAASPMASEHEFELSGTVAGSQVSFSVTDAKGVAYRWSGEVGSAVLSLQGSGLPLWSQAVELLPGGAGEYLVAAAKVRAQTPSGAVLADDAASVGSAQVPPPPPPVVPASLIEEAFARLESEVRSVLAARDDVVGVVTSNPPASVVDNQMAWLSTELVEAAGALESVRMTIGSDPPGPLQARLVAAEGRLAEAQAAADEAHAVAAAWRASLPTTFAPPTTVLPAR